MRFCIGIVVNKKIKDRYKKCSIEKEVSLRGKKIKTYERVGLEIVFEGVGVLRVGVVVVDSKFNSNYRGTLKLDTLKCNYKLKNL